MANQDFNQTDTLTLTEGAQNLGFSTVDSAAGAEALPFILNNEARYFWPGEEIPSSSSKGISDTIRLQERVSLDKGTWQYEAPYTLKVLDPNITTVKVLDQNA